MSDELLTVGELAARAGVTVRTLHHYDDLEILEPCRRSKSGYRLYGTAQVQRLQQILSLRRLGLSLAEIRDCLEDPDYTPDRVLELHIEHLSRRIEEARRLRQRLQEVRALLSSQGQLSADAFLDVAHATAMFDEHFTPGQRVKLREASRRVGPHELRAAGERWRELFARFHREMEAGTDPTAPAVRALAREARELLREFTGGDPGIAASLKSMYRKEGPGEVLRRIGMELPEGLWEYMAAARAAQAEGPP